MTKFIRIEPRKHYDKAIVRKLKSGKLVYSFNKLVKITTKHYSLNKEESEEWVHYNIIGGLNDYSYSLFGISYK